MDDLISRAVTRLIMPFIQLYGIFVIFHGHLSPGGAFSGGAILGSSLILYTLTFGLKSASNKLSHQTSTVLESLGVLWYMGIGLVGILMGGAYLSNIEAGFFKGTPGQLFSAGMIPLITLGVGIKVASTMITLFHSIIEEG